MFLIRLFSVLAFSVLSTFMYAQTGTLRGTLTDGDTGEAIMFGTVFVKESSTGSDTDLDGNFDVKLAPGLYTVEFSYVGYPTLSVEGVEIIADQVTQLPVQLKEEAVDLGLDIVVTAKAIQNTEVALLAIQKKASGLLDGISSQAIKRSGDGDVGGAIKRVTGVSVVDGKHVYVRGLGDRYSRTILNGMNIPGLDPDRNSVQLDIFPTNLVDNIIVHKSFSPNLPGDFTGGMVDIVTKDFPEDKTFSVSMSGSYNPSMHLNSNFIQYEGGSTDFLGFDDGTRKLPISTDLDIPSITDNSKILSTVTRQFNPTMATYRAQNGINTNFAASFGNQKNLEKFDFGYTVSANYRNETEYFDNAQYNSYFKNADTDVNELSLNRSINGELGRENVQWSSMIGTAIKSQNHKISLSAMHSQNAISRAALFDQRTLEFGQADIEKHTLEYTQRSVTNLLLAGKHSFGGGKLDLDWKLSPTLSQMDEPDIRTTAYETTNGIYELNRSTGGGVTRTWRTMDETSYNGRVDFTYNFEGIKKAKSKLMFGSNVVVKDRNFEIYDYIFPVRRRGTLSFTGDPNELFTEELIWTPENNAGVYTEFNFEPAKSYEARQNIIAGYAMNELPINERFKVIYGVRVEKADNWYTGRRQNITDIETDFFNDRKVLDDLDVLPSINTVYTLRENKDAGKTMNLRASASRTVARPSFKEKSIAQIDDRISGRTFIGNIDLESTDITNADLRWEYFLPKGQIVSVSAFYKGFVNPIELTAFDATSPNSFTPRNVGNATVTGVEFELRKSLDFVHPVFSKLSFNLNATVVNSSVEMTDEEIAGRAIAARTNETISDTRVMVGQSPYLINAGLTYLDRDLGWEGNISFNTQGERLSIVGIGNVPDVYEKPFDSLNFKLSKQLGATKQWKVSVGVQNILADTKERVYRAYEGDDEIFDLFEPGSLINMGISYKL